MDRSAKSSVPRPHPAPAPDRRARHILPLAAGSAALALLVAPALVPPQPRLLWNASPSVPIGLYRLAPGSQVHKGDLVAVRPTPALGRFMARRHYVERGVPLLKPVAAGPGARICRTPLRITIDGNAVARALVQDRFGRPLPRWTGCRRLARDELFLLATGHADSFDSRYFGPVRSAQVIGHAFPLWTWP